MNSTAAIVKSKVNRLKEGEVFDYSSFNTSDDKMEAIAKALSRLNSDGVIKRLSKGRYYKPKFSRFGELNPSENEIIKKYITNGYITGISAYNKLGLTSQIPNEIEIARNKRKSPVDINGVKLKFIKSDVIINSKNKEVLPILDALKNIKNIPDAEVDNSLTILKRRINQFDKRMIGLISNSVLKYNPATRALTGAILEEIDNNYSDKIKKTLNNLTTYKIGVSQTILPNKENWNLK